MTIPAVSAITSLLPTTAITSPTGVGAADTTTASSGADFGSSLASAVGKGVDAVQASQTSADNLAVKAATGDLTDIQDYTIATTQASEMTNLLVAIRDKGVDAFNQIMGMQA